MGGKMELGRLSGTGISRKRGPSCWLNTLVRECFGLVFVFSYLVFTIFHLERGAPKCCLNVPRGAPDEWRGCSFPQCKPFLQRETLLRRSVNTPVGSFGEIPTRQVAWLWWSATGSPGATLTVHKGTRTEALWLHLKMLMTTPGIHAPHICLQHVAFAGLGRASIVHVRNELAPVCRWLGVGLTPSRAFSTEIFWSAMPFPMHPLTFSLKRLVLAAGHHGGPGHAYTSKNSFTSNTPF